MPVSPHLRAALWITAAAGAFALLLVTSLLRSMMEDPNFGRGDNPFELLALLAAVLGPLLALGAAVALAFRRQWAFTTGRIAAAVLLVAAVAMVVNQAIAGSAESKPTAALQSAETVAGLASFASGVGLYLLLRRLPRF